MSVVGAGSKTDEGNLLKRTLRRRGRSRIELSTVTSGAQEVGVPGALDSETVARLQLQFEEDFSAAEFDLDIFDGTYRPQLWIL